MNQNMFNPTDVELIKGRMEVEYLLDVLDGCAFDCPGCFVKKKNKTLINDLVHFKNFVQTVENAFPVRTEVVLGSTDVFTARNFADVVESDVFQSLYLYNFVIPTTFMTDPGITEERMSMIRERREGWSPDCEFEIFAVIDTDKYLDGNKTYLTRFRKNLEICNPDVLVLVNNFFSRHQYKRINMVDLAAKLKEDFDAEFRLIPSFFRAGRGETVIPHALQYRDLLIDQMAGVSQEQNIVVDVVDRFVGPVPFLNYSFKEGEIYATSYMYFDDLPQSHELYHIPRDENGRYSIDTIHEALNELMSRQFEYAGKTDECSTCKYLLSCTTRNVLTYMESRGIKQCLLPRQLFEEQDLSGFVKQRTAKHTISMIPETSHEH